MYLHISEFVFLVLGRREEGGWESIYTRGESSDFCCSVNAVLLALISLFVFLLFVLRIHVSCLFY